MSNGTSPKCPQCGAPLSANAPGGLCPNCVMALNLKTETVFTDDTHAAQSPLPPEQIAPYFPQFEILECLGRGGMGVVYKARQKTLNRLVALKLLAPERVHDAQFAERFAREAQALAALNHPNIVTIYDFGQAGGFYFLLMEFVDGLNLRQLLRARKFSPEEALSIVPSLCDALQFAHDRGIVHRDIKPENVLLDKDGRVKVADFGIAKMLGTDNRVGEQTNQSENATQNAVGTPGYSAPEQKANPQRVDSRADIYSLGVVFYEMLTGELPGKRIEPPSRKVQIDVRLDEVVLRALGKTPELRWQTASAMRTELETIAATGSSATTSGPVANVPSVDLNRIRWKILIWGFALAVAAMEMKLNVSPGEHGFAIGVLGVNLAVVSATLALVFGSDLKMLRLASRLVSVDGILMASAGIWCAFNTPMLPMPWLMTIIAACLGGIIYCLVCLAKAKTPAAERLAAVTWTRKQAVLGVTIGLLFAAGTAAVAIDEFSSPSIDEVFKHASEGWYLEKAPPVVALRPNQGDPSHCSSTDTRIIVKAASLGALISYAYGPPTSYLHWSGNRVILATNMPDTKFDFLLAVPHHPQEALQAEIRRQLGLVAHREMRETSVLVLTVSEKGVTGLEEAKGHNGSDGHPAPGTFEFNNMPIDDLADFLELSLGQPVMDETRLTQKYSGSLKWNPQTDKVAEQKEIQNALLEQFGLKLVPVHQSIEMLVVEKVQ